jgi:PAS domain S-box-containing protein
LNSALSIHIFTSDLRPELQVSDAMVAMKEAFHGFLEAAPDAIVVVDAEGKIVAVNSLTEKMFGYRRDELIGQRAEMLVAERFRHRHDEFRQAYLQEPGPRLMGEGQELAGRCKDGSEFPVEISLSVFQTEGGRFVISIIRDISQRRQGEAKFRGLLESAPDGIVVVDASGRIVMVNSQTERMFGYRRDELIGQPVEILVPEKYQHGHVMYREGYFHQPRTRPMGAGRALAGRKRDGSEFPVEISLSPLETEQGVLVTSIIRDITDRRAAEEKIKASLREKELLLKEIHHRVKNNLQVTSSLLKLQSAFIHEPQAREMFMDSQNRIRSMALVHEKLYQSSDLSRIDFGEYLQSLAALLFRSFGADPRRITLRVEARDVFFGIDTAVPCGLIANELLSNSLKHAFPNGRSGQVDIRVEAGQDRRFMLSVRDNGIGLPAHIDPLRTETLGLQLVRTLADQLSGNVEVRRGTGTEFLVYASEAKG